MKVVQFTCISEKANLIVLKLIQLSNQLSQNPDKLSLKFGTVFKYSQV